MKRHDSTSPQLRTSYEWVYLRDGHPPFTTRNPRHAAMLKRAAARLGGRVERRVVGFTIRTKFAKGERTTP